MPLSLVMGNATALAVAAVRTRAGSASSVMGFGQFLLAGLVSPLVGMIGGSQAVGMGRDCCQPLGADHSGFSCYSRAVSCT